MIHQIISLKANSLVTHQKNVFKNGNVQSSDPKILQGNSKKKNFSPFSRSFQGFPEGTRNSTKFQKYDNRCKLYTWVIVKSTWGWRYQFKKKCSQLFISKYT